MSITYKETNVYEESLIRMNMIFDHNDEVIVAMSGGKDSTVVFNLALQVARERNRLPLKVFWLDQEAEWQNTVDYMDKIMHMPEVKPYWFQIPFNFPNNLSTGGGKESLLIWDPDKKDKWIHPQSDVSIKECPFDLVGVSGDRDNAFYTLMNRLPEYCVDEGTETCAVLSGMRVSESLRRRTAIMFGKGTFMGETWAREKVNKGDKCRVFWPIYDYTNDDIWTAIAKNHWEYNKCYDLMYRWGVNKQAMRVSALIHETSWHAIEKLQEEVENIGFDMSDIGLPKITLEDIPSSDGLATDIETEVKEKPAFGIPVPTPKASPEEKKISEEKMQELVKEFGERKMQELEEDPEFAEFMETPMYQCTCDKCGHTMFFKEGEV